MSKIDSLEPEFKPMVEQLIQAVEGITGRAWIVTSGRRTMAEQQRLYDQGRTTPGAIVTKAKPGTSAHNYGLAVDCAPLKQDGKTIDWNAPESMWKQYADLAVEMGLTAGFYFKSIKDMPHVEHPSWKEKQALWKAGKVEVA